MPFLWGLPKCVWATHQVNVTMKCQTLNVCTGQVTGCFWRPKLPEWVQRPIFCLRTRSYKAAHACREKTESSKCWKETRCQRHRALVCEIRSRRSPPAAVGSHTRSRSDHPACFGQQGLLLACVFGDCFACLQPTRLWNAPAECTMYLFCVSCLGLGMSQAFTFLFYDISFHEKESCKV